MRYATLIAELPSVVLDRFIAAAIFDNTRGLDPLKTLINYLINHLIDLEAVLTKIFGDTSSTKLFVPGSAPKDRRISPIKFCL